MEQLYKLSGDPIDLEDLARLFRTGSATVRKIDEHYYSGLADWDPAQTDSDALAIAETALTRMNAIALVRQENFRPPRVEGITRRDPVTGQPVSTMVIGATGIEGRSRVGVPTLTFTGETASSDQSPAFGEAVLSIADQNDMLERALQVYGSKDQHTWRGLYLVYEAIKEGVGGKDGLIALNVAPWSSIDDFKRTANSFRAIGVQSRHISGKEGNLDAKMTLPEAQTLIRQLLDAWIKELLRSQ